MNNNKNVHDVLLFRNDISPFLIHMTKNDGYSSAQEKIGKIFSDGYLERGKTAISTMRFAAGCDENNDKIINDYLSAISFTETPLNEIHTMFDLAYRGIDLQPYGLVFIKEKLMKAGVSPVLYLNTYFEKDKTKKVVDALWGLKDHSPDQARLLFPLISTFGEQFFYDKIEDFIWEREWRYVADQKFQFNVNDDVFLGFCPHEEISVFEINYHPLLFVDPRRNLKTYASKLVGRRKQLHL
jgi:hypothetical protein